MFGKLPPPACPGLCYYSIFYYVMLCFSSFGLFFSPGTIFCNRAGTSCSVFMELIEK